MLLVKMIDLDLEDNAEIYENAKETIKYLSDIVTSIESRVVDGEEVEGLTLVDGKKTRSISKQGQTYLEGVLGRDKVYKSTEKFIGITDLERLVDSEDMHELVNKGYVVYKKGKPKVVSKK